MHQYSRMIQGNIPSNRRKNVTGNMDSRRLPSSGLMTEWYFARRAEMCSAGKGGWFYRWTRVPVLPSMPSLAFSSRVIRAVRPALDSANFTAAWTLGSMEPLANWFSSI